MKKIIVFFAVVLPLLLAPLFAHAQYFAAESDVERLLMADSAALHLTIDNYNFLWNNEFFGPIDKGYTLIGFNLLPALEYHFTPNIKAKAGVRLTKYSGLDKFTDCLPVYSVTWHTDKLAVTMGTINGASFHRLPEPVMHRERQLINNYENGMQIVYNTNRLFADVWVDWQDFIFRGDNKKEQIYGGLSVGWKALSSDALELEIPASFTIFHRGGQIDTDTTPMRLFYYVSGGARLNHHLDGFISGVGASSQVIGYKDNSPTPESLYHSGWGWLSDVKLMHGKSSLSVGYWLADSFIAQQGNPMYMCRSYDGTTDQQKRSMFTGELNLAKDITDYFTAALTAVGYYDIKNSAFDYTYAFTFILRPDFVLWRR